MAGIQHEDINHTGLTGVGVGDATAHIADTTDAHDASAISFTPTGTIAATDVQAAIAEVASEAAGGSFSPDTHMPWRIDINPSVGMSVNTGFALGTIGEDQWADQGMLSTAQNHEIGCDIVLAAGTWSVFLHYWRHTSTGIATVSLAAGSVGTIDTYGTNTANIIGSITGISVATTGKKALLVKGATKNASSSGYALWISWITWVRTA